MKTTLELYCQYLLNSQINYTCTNLADHFEGLSHDAVYRFLKNEKLTPKLVWEKVKPLICQSAEGYIIFDDTVLDKIHSFNITGVRKQYSGNKHAIVKGIGVVNCVYFNPEDEQYWVIDYRIFDPERDGKSKIDHVFDMLTSVKHRGILFKTVLMDSWYATAAIMKYLIGEEKNFYCPIKSNRKVDDTQGKEPYQPVSKLEWNEQDLEEGKVVKLHKFPMDTRVKLFRVFISTDRTEHIITNDMTQHSAEAVKEESSNRWKIEEFHREEKQITGIGKSECRLNTSQRNHICAAMLVWVHLKNIAYKISTTIYQLKKGLLNEYLIKEMANASIRFS